VHLTEFPTWNGRLHTAKYLIYPKNILVKEKTSIHIHKIQRMNQNITIKIKTTKIRNVFYL